MSQPANEPASAPSLRQIPRRYVALGLIIVAIVLFGALVLVRDNSGPTTISTVETFNPAPSSLVSTVASVPGSVYDAVGVSSPANPVTPLGKAGSGNAPSWLASVNDGPPLPVVFFYGAEFAPYAAVERWPLIMALSRFGSFNQLGLMQSSPTTAFAEPLDVHLLEGLVLEPLRDPGVGGALQLAEPDGGAVSRASRPPTPGSPRRSPATGRAPTPSHCSTSPTGTSSTAPRFSPTVLAGLSQGQIAGDLTTPASPMTQAMVTAANEITAAICSVDGDRPDAVCESKGVLAADQVLKITPPH